MVVARSRHTATLLPSGKVLIAGGLGNSGGDVAIAELYDPVAGTFTATGSLLTPVQFHTATLLPNGEVLIAGGRDDLESFNSVAIAELYDPVARTFAATGSLALAREQHTATLLPNGQVLVAAGGDVSAGEQLLSSAELYNPATGTFTATGDLATARADHTATLLPTGQVLVAGGIGLGYVAISSSEMYDPIAGTFTTTGSLATPRAYHTATLLPKGEVLIVDGLGPSGESAPPLASAELYDPGAGAFSPQ
jgi:hypothetical protein